MTAELPDLFQRAQRCLLAGEIERAREICEQVVDADPANGEALNLLGMIAQRSGQIGRAIEHIEAAIRCDPDSPVFYNNLGAACLEAGQYDRAADCCRRAIDAGARNALPHLNLGHARRALGDPEGAMACYREALRISPDLAAARVAMGRVRHSTGNPGEAVEHYRQALALSDDPAIRFELAGILAELGRHERAVDLYRGIASANPDYPGLRHNLGLSLVRLGRFGEAVDCYREAIALDPDNAVTLNSLGNALTQLGRPGDAIECFRRALALAPDYAKAHSNLLLNMNYLEDEQDGIYRESRRFEARHSHVASVRAAPFAAAGSAAGKLRVGYVSGDFRDHSVAYFLLPLLEAHDRQKFEVCCYPNNRLRDEVTERFERLADRWTMIHDHPDDAAAELIRRDQIDILVDLSGHTAGNRLQVFARKPAPVQVSWLGYPNTTGLRTVDFRLTDAVADPAGAADGRYTERLVRLPGGFICYRGDERSPPVSSPPGAARGYVTFGSFNMLGKISPGVVDAWSEILKSVPDSRLMLKAQSLADEQAQATLRALFRARGIAPQRLDLLGLVTDKAAHLELYSRIDIALDTFPYNGTTTSCEAIWMGVPVITLLGEYHAGRVGASILHGAGMQEFVAPDRSAYVSLARELAADAGRRQALRESQREKVRRSVLMDRDAFAASVENAYRDMRSALRRDSR